MKQKKFFLHFQNIKKLVQFNWLYLFIIAAVFLALGCSTARSRYKNWSLLGDLNSSYISLNDQHRTGTIYNDFRLVLGAEVWIRDRIYIEQIIDSTYLNKGNFSFNADFSFSFVLSIYQPDFQEQSAKIFAENWDISLIIDDKTSLSGKITKLNKNDYEYKFLRSYFYLIDSWNTVYIATFTYDPKTLKLTASSKADLKLSNLLGSTTLRWENFGRLIALK